MFKLFTFCLISTILWTATQGAVRTSPSPGSVIVRSGTKTSGEFSTIAAALASLPDDSSTRSIFIYPGTYSEQIYITRSGPLTIYGFTNNTDSYMSNQVTIQAAVPASIAGSDDASGTLRVHKDDFKMYNVNVKNNYGVGSQAIAISQYGNRVGLYACGFYGYQDTLYANKGTQVYLKGYIEAGQTFLSGAVDFIFGRTGLAYFGGNTIGVKAPGCITASGRQSNDSGSYVFDHNTIIFAPGASSSASREIYLGRPWADYAKVIFKNTVVTAPLNPAIWSVWNAATPNTDHVFLAEYNTTGSGVSGASRPTFATVLSVKQAASYSISSVVGNDYASWVDAAYIV